MHGENEAVSKQLESSEGCQKSVHFNKTTPETPVPDGVKVPAKASRLFGGWNVCRQQTACWTQKMLLTSCPSPNPKGTISDFAGGGGVHVPRNDSKTLH